MLRVHRYDLRDAFLCSLDVVCLFLWLYLLVLASDNLTYRGHDAILKTELGVMVVMEQNESGK